MTPPPRPTIKPAVALTIAGSDSGGGAGIVADLKTFEALGAWGTTALVAVTAQNTLGVQAFETLPPALVRAQIESVVTDIGVDAAKTGMLASAELVVTVAGAVRDFAVPNLVVDPVFVSKHGDTLLADDAVLALRTELLPLARLTTPNLPEASALVGFDVFDRDSMVRCAEELLALGVGAVLVKGGHLADGDSSPDCLLEGPGAEPVWLEGHRIAGRHTHGTGCVLSAAITAELARRRSVPEACLTAKRFVERAIAAGLELGAGVGPVNPGWGAS
ncbi:MAG TPA: bifunctional hydroxymethylpyrimidine kinase/phosphomethylpyrimidine kinase [Acidimicrobiales bacterium]|nr:bifunctional hydroxymethylpyrimidine kinase/phosphomethylpyrimidine kinase [Acidimicrobiales bacterium]